MDFTDLTTYVYVVQAGDFESSSIVYVTDDRTVAVVYARGYDAGCTDHHWVTVTKYTVPCEPRLDCPEVVLRLPS